MTMVKFMTGNVTQFNFIQVTRTHNDDEGFWRRLGWKSEETKEICGFINSGVDRENFSIPNCLC